MLLLGQVVNSQNHETALKLLRAYKPVKALEEISSSDNHLIKTLITSEANYLINGTIDSTLFIKKPNIENIEEEVLYNLFYGDYLRRLPSKKSKNTSILKQKANNLYTESLLLSEKLDNIYKSESLWRILDYEMKNSSENETPFNLVWNYINDFDKLIDPDYAFWGLFFKLNYKIIVTNETKKRISIKKNSFAKLKDLANEDKYLLGRSLQLESLYYTFYVKDINKSYEISCLAKSKYISVPYFFSQYRSKTIMLNIADDLYALNRIKEAKKILLTLLSDAIFERTEQLHKSDIYKRLKEIYKKEGNYKRALYFSEKFNENEEKVRRDNVSIGKDKNARRFNLEKLKKTIIKNSKYFTIALILVFIIALYSVVRWKKSDKAKKTINTQLEKLIEKEKLLRKKIQEVESQKVNSVKEVKLLKGEIEQTIQEIERLKRITILEHIVLINGVRLPLSDLMYIKADGHFLHFFIINDREFVAGTLKEVLNNLPPNFIQVHRSYIVNLNFIHYSDSIRLTLKDKTEIRIGRKYKTEVKKMIELSNALK